MRSDSSSRIHRLIAASLAPGTPSVVNLEPVEWESLWVQARTHCLTPYLHWQWAESGTLRQLTPDIARRFETARTQNAERNRRILLDLEEIYLLLESHGIPALVLKGLPVAKQYYGDTGLRVLYDLDLLIRPVDLPRALDLLRRIGYVSFLPEPLGQHMSLLWRPKECIWDAEGVFDPERPIFVDLQTRPWEPRWHGFRLECNLDLWQGKRVQEIAGVMFRVPSEEKLLVHLAVHYAFNALESNARLMHLLDVALLLRSRGRVLDWDTILRDIEESRVASFCFLTLDLARRICGSEIPERVWSELRKATPRGIVSWLGMHGVEAAHSMSLYHRDRSLIYALHWAMASGWAEKTYILLYSLRGPWLERKGAGHLWALAHRMGQRLRHLMGSSRIL